MSDQSSRQHRAEDYLSLARELSQAFQNRAIQNVWGKMKDAIVAEIIALGPQPNSRMPEDERVARQHEACNMLSVIDSFEQRADKMLKDLAAHRAKQDR